VKEWKRLVADTPEDYCYDPDPLFEVVEKYFDGMDNPPNKITRPLRKPRTEEERTKFRRVVKNPDMLKDYLTDPNCPHCYGKGSVSYFYDPANPRLEASHPCSCWIDEPLPDEVLKNKADRMRKPAVSWKRNSHETITALESFTSTVKSFGAARLTVLRSVTQSRRSFWRGIPM
jgi:hypothetical protein